MKLPVFKAVAMTFAFVASNILEIIKIVWLPIALMVGLFALIGSSVMQSMAGMATLDANASPEEAMSYMAAVLPASLGVMAIAVVFYLLIFAGILRLVIHGEKPKLPFYIGSGGDELRVFGTWVLGFLIFFGAYIAIAFVGGLLFALTMNLSGVGPIVLVVVMIAAWVALIWLCLRLSLATPAAVGQRTIGIGPSWNVSKGNVWSLFGYWIIWGILLFLVEIVTIAVTMPGYFEAMGAIFTASAGGDTAGVEAATQKMNEAALGIYNGSAEGIARLAGGTVIGVLVLVFMAVAGGVAWRLMTETSPEKHFE
jgi:hypothetical protein